MAAEKNVSTVSGCRQLSRVRKQSTDIGHGSDQSQSILPNEDRMHNECLPIPNILLECPTCQKRTSSLPVLPCYHYFCSECLEEMKSRCRLCGKAFSGMRCRDVARENTFVEKILFHAIVSNSTPVSSRLCSDCERARPDKVCLPCKRALCRSCCKNHGEALKDGVVHETVSVRRYGSGLASPLDKRIKCPFHSLKMRFYCSVCDVIICNACVESDHYHRFENKPIAPSQGRLVMKDKLDRIRYKLLQISIKLTTILSTLLSKEGDAAVHSDKIWQEITEARAIASKSTSNQGQGTEIIYKQLKNEVKEISAHQKNRPDNRFISLTNKWIEQTTAYVDALDSTEQLHNSLAFLYLAPQLLARMTDHLKFPSNQFEEEYRIAYSQPPHSTRPTGVPNRNEDPKYFTSPKFRLTATLTGSQEFGPVTPHGLIVRGEQIVVAERLRNRLRKLDRKGRDIVPPLTLSVPSFDPVDIADESERNIVVTDFKNRCLHRIDVIDWKLVKTFAEGDLEGPQGISMNRKGDFVVTDCNCISARNECGVKVISAGGAVYRLKDDYNGFLDLPWGIATNANDDVIIANQRSHHIRVIGINGNSITEFGHYGNDDATFRGPIAVAVDRFDNILVGSNNRVQLFDSKGGFICRVNSMDDSKSRINGAVCGIDVNHDANYEIFVADTENDNIKVFTLDRSTR
ncbi:E3 ubiquitin-protein ligase TRIM71-like [Ptychodera flava]|uniref:E3 ubiquitin-protein ligase TRIM71-like n=1 Tax=Ptychodera flava TaxID=63121 RepID=UPI003969D6EF